MDIQTIMRAQDVTRWNIVHTIRKQTLAEHSFNVAMLARELCTMLEAEDSTISLCTECALHHDLDEIITGDIPSPTKERAKERGWDLNTLARSNQKDKYPPHVLNIVKMADIAENLWYIAVYGHGRHARQVEAKLVESVEKLYPSDQTLVKRLLHRLTHGEIAI